MKEMTIEMIDEVADLFNQYRMFYKQESDFPNAVLFLTERLKNEESIVYVAMNDGKCAGFTQLYPLFSSVRMRSIWLLNDLFVSEDYRGKGISKLLIDRAKQLTTETNSAGLMLETDVDNTIGNNLYPATGFELDKDHYHYWWGNPNQ